MAILSPNRVENSSQVTVWLPYRQNGSGLFYNIYSKELFNETLWSSGQPGLYKQCLICEMTGCQSEDCQIKQSFFCSYDQWPVVAKIRGLCMNTALSFAYYPYSKIGFFSWVSIDGTYIIYNSTAQMWQIAVADNNVRAESLAPYDSFLIGTQHWTMWNSFTCYAEEAVQVRVVLDLCSENDFSCDDGGCVSLNSKCDGLNDCKDGSDELSCKIVQLPSNYNKQLSPLYFSTDKAKVDLSFEVIDVLDIDEKIGNLRVKFRFLAAWNDYRVNFQDLWRGYAMNTISKEEMDVIWQPRINFDNAVPDHFHYNLKPDISVIYNMSTTWKIAPPSQLYKAFVYSGLDNSFFLRALIRLVEGFYSLLRLFSESKLI